MAPSTMQAILAKLPWRRGVLSKKLTSNVAEMAELVPLTGRTGLQGGDQSLPPPPPLSKAVISVKGMHCSSCSSAVESALRALPGIASATVALLSESAEVMYDPSCLKASAIVGAVVDAGFEASLVSDRPLGGGGAGGAAAVGTGVQLLTLTVEGMTCAACSGALESALRALPGVDSAQVSLSLGQARVALRPGAAGATTADLLEAVEGCGFEGALAAHVEAGSARLLVQGMTCSACSVAVQSALLGVPGVLSAAVDVLGGVAEARYDPDATGPRALVAAVEGAGFGAAPAPEAQAAGSGSGEAARWFSAFLVSASFTAPVFAVAMLLRHMDCMAWLYQTQVDGFPLDQLLKAALTTPVQFWCGARFHVGAARALRRGRANMDVLVSLGSNAAYFYSLLSILHHHLAQHHATLAYKPTDFFETSAMLITLVLFGKWLEAGAKAQTGTALAALAALAPSTAWLVEEGGDGDDPAPGGAQEREIGIALVQRGDVLKVLPGARIPADGVVEAGTSNVDESLLTGEAVPVPKAPGDALIGGSVNLGGTLRMRTSKVGADTALSQIVRLVEGAQLSKAPIQAYADRVSAVFVPVVVALALLTFASWYYAGVWSLYPASWLPEGHTPFMFALLFGIAVVVVACPCALGLATPTAVMVGTGVGARHGILIKGGEALERAASVTTVVFDKTGTLTEGRPHAVDLRVFLPDLEPADAAGLAACLEQDSEHPLAGAVLTLAATLMGQGKSSKVEGLVPQGPAPQPPRSPRTGGRGAAAAALAGRLPSPQDFEALAGEGVRGRVPLARGDGSPYFARPAPLAALAGGGTHLAVAVGSPRFMAQCGVALDARAQAYLRDMQGRGCTCVAVAGGGALLAAVAVQDPLKAEARGVVAALHTAGLACVLLTGDNWRTARALASALGIRRVCAEVLPAGKVEVVHELQAARPGAVVAMVGDGVNDSPALAAADVGIAVGTGADVAIEAADFVLVRSDLEDVLTAMHLSRSVLRRIRWNYAFALGYNAMAIPVAAGALYPLFHVQLPPWVAGACMALSSVSVVCSSLLLKRYTPRRRVLRDVIVIKGHAD